MEYRCQEPLADMSYRFEKVSAQTDVTSVRPLLPPLQFPAYEVGARCGSLPGGTRTLPGMACGQPSSQVSIRSFAGRDFQRDSIFYFPWFSNAQNNPVLEEIEVHSDSRF